jgi:hypothetical protein
MPVIRIRYTAPSSLEISGDLETLRVLRRDVLTLIEAEGPDLTVEAYTAFDPAPYKETIPRLVISRGRGLAKVEVAANREVHVSGSVENLKGFASCFDFGLGGVFGPHQHYEYFEGHPFNIAPDSVPLVVRIE